MIRFFRVTPPTVHQMVSLEKAALISRKPGAQCAISAMSLSEAISHRSKHHRATRVWPKPAASPIDVGSERVGRRAAVFVFRVLIARRA